MLTVNTVFLSPWWHPGGHTSEVALAVYASSDATSAQGVCAHLGIPGQHPLPGHRCWLPWFAMATVEGQPRLPLPCCWTPQGIRSMEKHIPTGCHGNVAQVKQRSLCFHLDFPPSQGNTKV